MKQDSTIERLLDLALSGSRETPDHLTRAALREYSVAGVFRSIASGKQPQNGIERDVARSLGTLGGNGVSGFPIPFGALLPSSKGRRDMTATGFAQGGAAVPADMHPAIELLWNRVVAVPLGATVLPGLTGSFLAPRETSGAVATNVPEIGGATPSGFTTDQPSLTPKRVTIQIPVSLQMLTQTAGVAEMIIRRQIRRALGTLMDSLALFGDGYSDQPLGLINTPGVGVVTFGGAATWPNVLLFEEQISLQNSDEEKLGWAISPATRNRWKQISRISATNYPSFIMEGGKVNDYPTRTSNQLAGQNQTIFGDWPSFWILMWGDGIDLTWDAITQSYKGEAIATAHLWVNFLTCHPQAFCVASDSASQ
jgi:hypothetical protein